MDFKEKLQQLSMLRNQATKEAIMQENVLQGARQTVAEIQGRINMLQEIMAQEAKPKRKKKDDKEEKA